MAGPVSSALEDELLSEIRRHSVVVWLDKDGAYTAFVDDLVKRHRTDAFDVPVVAFRGSFVEVILALEAYGSGLDNPTALLVHMPGFNEETLRVTPVLELYEAGYRYRRALDTLVREAARGHVAPDEVERFVAAPALTLEAADTWLEGHTRSARAGLEGLLAQMSLVVIAEELLVKGTFLPAKLGTDADREVLAAYLYKQTGMNEAWTSFYGSDPRAAPLANLAAAFGAWLLCVEYAHDLARRPHLPELQPLRDLSPELARPCVAVVEQLRARHPERYAALADEIEAHLEAELDAIAPAELGKVDTFRKEEARVLGAAVLALRAGAWEEAGAYAAGRANGSSFWLGRDPSRRSLWMLVTDAATLGTTLGRMPRPLELARSLEEALAVYTQGAFEVDRAHRRFEQQCLKLLEARLPEHFGDMQEIRTTLRQAYRAWADALARDFAAICRERGFLPEASLQQRTLYEQVVLPLTAGPERVAIFLVDALRYEMAVDVAEELQGAGTQVDLRARLAELPTITSVGMNALAPVATNGRLALAGKGGFGGFKTGEYTVDGPGDRARAMGMRSLGKAARQLWLAEVCEDDAATLKRKLGGDNLVVVCSKVIDDAGEANVGLLAFEHTRSLLKTAWHRLQSAGVKQFVFTADHGFLLQDPTTRILPFGKKTDPSRRHVLDDSPRAETGMVNVSLAALGYLGPAGEPASGYLLFREDTAVFATGTPGATFVHGGNSLQERVIPVLLVGSKRVTAAGPSAHVIETSAQNDALGMHRLLVRIVWSKEAGLLPLGTPTPLDLAMRVPGRDDIRVTIKDAPKAMLRNGRLQVPVREGWTEVFFTLEGPADERVLIEVFHPDAVEAIAPRTAKDWFAVAGTGSGAPPATLPPPTGPSWHDAFADEGLRRVFSHLEKHGSMTEEEITRALGSPRAFRRFSLDFETHTRKVPFKVRIETTPDGKRYVKDGST